MTGTACAPSFDRDGYPTDETFEIIEAWNPCDPAGLFEFIVAAWHDIGCVRRDGWGIELVTGGWSGNEALLVALRHNIAWSICWESSHRGGLHRFAIPEK